MANVIYKAIPYLSVWLRTTGNMSTGSVIVPAVMKGEIYESDGQVVSGWIHMVKPRVGWTYGVYWEKIGKTADPVPDKPPDPPPDPPRPPNPIVETENTDTIGSGGRTIIGSSDSAYSKLYWRYIRAFGCPPQFSTSTDINYTDNITSGTGRVFAKTLLSNPTILSLCPGKVDYLPGFSGTDKNTFYKKMINMSTTDQDLKSRLSKDDETNKLNGKLYEFKQAYNEYMKIVNVLCRSCALFLGIGDETIPWGNKTLKHFDYSWWTNPDKEPHKPTSKTSIFGTASEQFGKAVGTAVGDDNYIHFFVTQQGTSVSESISTSTQSSILEETINSQGLNKMGRNLEFLFGGPVGGLDGTDDLSSDINALFGSTNGKSGFISSFGKIAANYFKGGRMIFPQMIDDVQYDKSISCSAKFISPYGDKLSIFLRCYVPMMHMLAFALPKQLAQNMYTYPFLVRAFQKGWFNTDLAAITNLQITKGGSDDSAWTIDGLSTEWEVKFDITPLYSELMVTSSSNPFLFMQNTSLVEYLATICGVDLKVNNLGMKIEIATAMLNNTFSDIPSNLARGIGENLASKIQGIFQIQNR